MKILILGNMANDGYSVAKAMKKLGMDVTLAVNVSDFGMSLPEWEEVPSTTADPYSRCWSELHDGWSPPDWISYFDMHNTVPLWKNPAGKALALIKLLKLMRDFDVIESHVPFSIDSQFSGKPYVPYDAGWIRYLPSQDGNHATLAKRSYVKARSVMFTNPDTEAMFSELRGFDADRLHFVPFAIDMEKYGPTNGGTTSFDPLLFSPTRHLWREKGNDILIRAYASFAREHPKSRLLLVDWGPDVERSRELISKLIPSDKVEWLRPMTKPVIIQFYNRADIILDQFILGSWGTTTPEVMACGKSPLMYYNEDHIARCFGSLPPLFNCPTESSLFNGMELLADERTRTRKGQEARDWVEGTHDDEKVASMHYEILKAACEEGAVGKVKGWFRTAKNLIGAVYGAINYHGEYDGWPDWAYKSSFFLEGSYRDDELEEEE